MGINNIEKYSFSYSSAKHIVDFWHNKVFYREVTLLNTQNIPDEGPLIFTPNHQNALMDALAMLCTVDRRLVFMARSDIFKKPVIASILYFMRILPIYRIRDGYESLKKNEEIFQKTIDVLTDKNCALVILPEGNHSGIRRLRPLKKGFARIAFQTEEANNFSLDIKIIPVGIYYDDYEAFRSRLIINFGKPISVKKYYDQYREAPAIAINLLKNELSEHIKSLIIDIETEKYYDLINTLRRLYEERLAERLQISGQKKKSLPAQQLIVNGLQKVVDTEPGKIDLLDQKVHQYLKNLKEIKLNGVYRIEKTSLGKILSLFCLLVLFFPVHLYGVVNNFIPFSLSIWAKKKIKDPQFKSSFLYVVSLVAFPLLQTLQTVLVAFFVDHWYWVAAYFVSVPLSGAFLIYYHNLANKFQRALKIFKLFRKRKTYMDQLQNDYQEILNIVDSLLHIDQADFEKQTR